MLSCPLFNNNKISPRTSFEMIDSFANKQKSRSTLYHCTNSLHVEAVCFDVIVAFGNAIKRIAGANVLLVKEIL